MHDFFMARAFALALENVEQKRGGPFAAVIVKDGEIIGEGVNQVTAHHDPTAHAEVQAIRNTCAALCSFQLKGAILYSSCEPCPMCFGAIYWARLGTVFFGANRHDAAAVGFDDSFIYEQIVLPPSARSIPMIQMMQPEAKKIFQAWEQSRGKIHY
jgi:guanine deaminase